MKVLQIQEKTTGYCQETKFNKEFHTNYNEDQLHAARGRESPVSSHFNAANQGPVSRKSR